MTFREWGENCEKKSKIFPLALTPQYPHKISGCLLDTFGKKTTLGKAEAASLTFALFPGTLSNGENTQDCQRSRDREREEK